MLDRVERAPCRWTWRTSRSPSVTAKPSGPPGRRRQAGGHPRRSRTGPPVQGDAAAADAGARQPDRQRGQVLAPERAWSGSPPACEGGGPGGSTWRTGIGIPPQEARPAVQPFRPGLQRADGRTAGDRASGCTSSRCSSRCTAGTCEAASTLGHGSVFPRLPASRNGPGLRRGSLRRPRLQGPRLQGPRLQGPRLQGPRLRRPGLSRQSMKARVLVVEDDKDISLGIRTVLGRNGFDVMGARLTARMACASFTTAVPTWSSWTSGCPRSMGGQCFKKQILRDLSGNVPVLILTAHGNKPTRSAGCTGEPMTTSPSRSATASSAARLEALLRRPRGAASRRRRCTTTAACRWDLGSREVSVEGAAVALTPTEYRAAGRAHPASGPDPHPRTAARAGLERPAWDRSGAGEVRHHAAAPQARPGFGGRRAWFGDRGGPGVRLPVRAAGWHGLRHNVSSLPRNRFATGGATR